MMNSDGQKQTLDESPRALARAAAGNASVNAPHVLVLHAFLVAVARLIPLPIVDDWAGEQLLRSMVRALLRRAGRTLSSGALSPLYASGGCLDGCLGVVIGWPLKLLLFPIRKFIAIFRAIHGTARRMVEVFLLGHVVGRWLARGGFAEGTPPDGLHREAALVRVSFDQTLSEVYPASFTGSLVTAWSGMRGLLRSAALAAQQIVRGTRRQSPADAESRAAATSAAAEASSERFAPALGVFEALLTRPDIVEFLQQFEARFEANLNAERDRRNAAARSGG
jgi:hypothetical protein